MLFLSWQHNSFSKGQILKTKITQNKWQRIRDLLLFIAYGRGGVSPDQKYRNDAYIYHIFDSSSIPSNKHRTRPTSVIVVQSHFLFTSSIIKQATNTVRAWCVFFCASCFVKIISFAQFPCNNFSVCICHLPWPHTRSLPVLVAYFFRGTCRCSWPWRYC